MVIDIYNEYRINLFLNSNKTKFLQFKDFINDSLYFKNLKNYKIREIYINGITYYLRKFQHILLFNPLNQINDKYEYFVKYTFALTSCLNKLRPLFVSGRGCPLMIDFWIIPNHVISVSDVTMPTFGNTDNDNLFNYIDDDDIGDATDFIDELNAPNSDDNDPQIGKIEERLDYAKIQYIKEIINHSEHKNEIAIKMLNGIKFICKSEYQFKRIIIIIDRRNSSQKLNKSSDRMYIYQPPNKHGIITNTNKVYYNHQTLNNLSLSYILAKLRNEKRIKDISCCDDLKGRMFIVYHFHIYSINKIQSYWFSKYPTLIPLNVNVNQKNKYHNIHLLQHQQQ